MKNLDSNSKKQTNKTSDFSIMGMIIITLLGIGGGLAIYYSGIFNAVTKELLYDCIAQNGFMIIFGGFFICTSIYCWILCFKSIFSKPKKVIMYLVKNSNDDKTYFINEKGKKFNYIFNDNTIEEGNYYYVLKKDEIVCKILEKTNANWVPKERKSYWLNIYTPVGNYEDLLLPIVYVILLPGLLSIFMSKGYQIIYGLLYCLVPSYMIVYDLIYKIKLKKSNYKEIDDTNFVKSYEILINTVMIISSIAICIFFLSIFLNLKENSLKIIFIPFICCGLCNFGYSLAKAFNNNKAIKVFLKGYIIIFLTYWFGFLLYFFIKNVILGKDYMLGVFTIPFWIAGFVVLYLKVIKDK